MKVLFSAMNTIEYDGQYYYNNAIPDMYRRYLILGDDITLLCHAKKVDKAKSQKIDPQAIKIIIIPKRTSAKALLFNSSKRDRLLKEEVSKADLCVIHLPSNHGNKVIEYAKKLNKPYITVICGCPWDSLWNYDWRGKLLAPSASLNMRKAQHDAPYSIYVTKHFLQKRYPTSGKWINCSNVEMSTGMPGVLERRLDNITQRRADGRTIRIGTAAAIDVPYKGQEYVIRAIGKLKEKGIDMEYHMIGNGSKDRLQAIVDNLGLNDRVFFHGGLPHDKVAEFYDDMDIYIQPSKQEGLPRATIEAMSRGCLCIGSDIAGIPELLDDAHRFPKGNVNRLVDILSTIKPEDYAEQGKRNYETAKDYDRDVLNERRKNFLLEFKNHYFTL